MGAELRCPGCGRPHHAVTLRSGDVWLVCWYKPCAETAWAIKLPAVQPIARDVELAVGARLAAALLATFAPAPVVSIAVPPAIAAPLRLASRVQVVNRLTAVFCPEGGVRAAVAPKTWRATG